jgi:transcriptional regulator with XRE-family HTH domain
MEEKNISQAVLCAKLGVNKSAFSDWKNGKSKSYIKHLALIATILDVSVDYLLCKTEIKKAPVESDKGDRSAMEQEFIELYRRLNTDQKKTVLAFMQVLSEKEGTK